MVPRVSDPLVVMELSIENEAETPQLIDVFIPEQEEDSRPPIPRRVTAPESPTLNALSTFSKPVTPTLALRPRNSSPFRKTHLRSKSSASSLAAPQMARAHSSPTPDSAGRAFMAASARPSSPLGPPGRRQSPLRRSSDEPYLSFGGQVDIGETISENSELDLTPRPTTESDLVSNSPILSINHTFPRIRRRPSSPFYPTSTSTARTNVPTSMLRTCTSSPSLSAVQFNEPYPSYYSFSSSSIPSTPSSFRSRSPSISSLETIPDSPDAELEAENIALLKAAADKENESEGSGVRRRGSMELMGRPGVMRDQRKRWSVCGAERRGDLDLETIWED